jgi:hypothetical protein
VNLCNVRRIPQTRAAIRASRRPVVVVGHGARHAVADLVALATCLHAPVTTAVKYDIPVRHVLSDNAVLGKISKEQRAAEYDVWQTALRRRWPRNGRQPMRP